MTSHASGRQRKQPAVPMATSRFKFILRPIRNIVELDKAFHLFRQDSWIITMDKFRTIFRTFQNDMYVVETEDGQWAGTMSQVPSRPREWVTGNLVVDKKFRNMGLGRWMQAECFGNRPDDCIVTVFSAGKNIGFYRKCGYIQTGEVLKVFVTQVETKEVEENLKSMSGSNDITVKPYTPDMFEAVRGYDNDQRGYDMVKYLSVLTRCTTMFVASHQSTGEVVGYAAAYQKGPSVILDGLYADSDEIALHLFRDVLNAFPDRTDVVFQTMDSRLFLASLGRKVEDQCGTVYRLSSDGRAALMATDKVYSVTDCDYS